MGREIILDPKGSELFRGDLKELLELLQIHVYVPIDNIKTLIEVDYYGKGERFPGAERDEELTRRSILRHYEDARRALHKAGNLLSMMSNKAYYRANNEAYQLLSRIFWDIKKIEDSLWYGIDVFRHYPDDPASTDELYDATVKSLEILDRMINELVNAMNRGVFM